MSSSSPMISLAAHSRCLSINSSIQRPAGRRIRSTRAPGAVYIATLYNGHRRPFLTYSRYICRSPLAGERVLCNAPVRRQAGSYRRCRLGLAPALCLARRYPAKLEQALATFSGYKSTAILTEAPPCLHSPWVAWPGGPRQYSLPSLILMSRVIPRRRPDRRHRGGCGYPGGRCRYPGAGHAAGMKSRYPLR